jgi:hypothetical protein
VTRIGSARVVEMAEESSLAFGTLAVEGADAVVTRGAVETRGGCAVVDVVGARDARPAVDANAREGAERVHARGAVVTHMRAEGALVHVARAVRARPLRGARARVGVEAVDTSGAVLAEVRTAVVDVVLTEVSSEANGTLTREGQRLVVRNAVSAVVTHVVFARHVPVLTTRTCEALVTVAAEVSESVETKAVSGTHVFGRAFVHVLRAVAAGEAFGALAVIPATSGHAFGAVFALVLRAVVLQSAQPSRPAVGADTLEVLQRVLELTFAVIETRVAVADGWQLDFAQGGGVAETTQTLE